MLCGLGFCCCLAVMKTIHLTRSEFMTKKCGEQSKSYIYSPVFWSVSWGLRNDVAIVMIFKLEILCSLVGNQNKHWYLLVSLKHPPFLHNRDFCSLVIKLSATVVSLTLFFSHMKKVNQKSSVTTKRHMSFILLKFRYRSNLLLLKIIKYYITWSRLFQHQCERQTLH